MTLVQMNKKLEDALYDRIDDRIGDLTGMVEHVDEISAAIDAQFLSLGSPVGASLVGLPVSGNVANAIAYITPRMFGAVGNGVADDTAAVQAALNYAATITAINGRRRKPVIDFGFGVYLIKSTLIVSGTDFYIVGAGAQSTELLIDHVDGPAISYTADNPWGFATFAKLVVRASDTRMAYTGTGAAGLHGILSDPGSPDGSGNKTTFRLRFINVFSLDHPGDCFRIIQPEALLMDDCAGNRSKLGYGIYIWGRDLPNISGQITQTSVEGNYLNGLYVYNMTEMSFSHIRALNNRGAGGQIKVEGENCTFEGLDCEAFNLIDSGDVTLPTLIGLSLSGRGHRIFGSGFYGLNVGIRMLNADDCILQMPRFGGKNATYPMTTGVSFESGSDNNYLKMSTYTGNYVINDYTITSGSNNTINLRGYELGASEGLAAVEAFGVSGTYTPDASLGSYFRLTVTGATTIAFPSNLKKGQKIKLEITQGGSGGYAISFNSGYGAKFINTGNILGSVSTINFIASGATVMSQDGGQGLWQANEVGATTIAFAGTIVAAGAVTSIPIVDIGSAALGMAVLCSLDTDLQGLRINSWVSAAGKVSYQFHNPTAASITIPACNIRFLCKRLA